MLVHVGMAQPHSYFVHEYNLLRSSNVIEVL